jgi:hypothetical protein
MARPTFEQACAAYPHRYTLEFRPEWATRPDNTGKFYAPQYRSDREWYDNTVFPGEGKHGLESRRWCYSSNQTWPLGNRLDHVFQPKGR